MPKKRFTLLAVQQRVAESRIVVARGGGKGEMGRCWSKGTKFQLCRMNKLWKSNAQHGNCS